MSEQAKRTVHPADLDYVLNLIDREKLLGKLAESNSSLIVFRFVLDGEIMHVCHFSIMCDDKKHILGCIKNIETEFLEREEQEYLLQSAERLARLDELTGIRNKNAFTEYVKEIDEVINGGEYDPVFGVVMCGMAKYNPGVDRNFQEVYNRADGRMYANKNELKAGNIFGEIRKREESNEMIPDDRMRKLNRLYGALHTVAGGAYSFVYAGYN